MADRWIVSAYCYTLHTRLEIAEREKQRLIDAEKNGRFRIYRVKTTLPASNTKAVLKAADDVCEYVGYNIKDIKDPFLVALVAKLQYEIAMRTKSLHDEEIADAYLPEGSTSMKMEWN